MASTPLFDAHLHAEGLVRADLDTLRHFGLEGAVSCAHDAFGPATSQNVLAHFRAVLEGVDHLRLAGLHAWAALGVHPAKIPWHGLEEVLHQLAHLFDDGRVVALGEVGLHAGGEREEMVLARQLELAVAVRCAVVVHTPDRDKVRLTRRLLAMLKESEIEPAQVLVDHADAGTWKMIHACGHTVGLTTSRLAPDDLASIVGAAGADAVVLTSDLGDGPADLLALPRAADRLLNAGLSAEVVRRVACHNARELFALDEKSLRRSG